MYFDELRPRRNRKGIAQEYWNGAAASDPSLSADIFDAAISMLPGQSSSQPDLRIKLQDMGESCAETFGRTTGVQPEAIRRKRCAKLLERLISYALPSTISH